MSCGPTKKRAADGRNRLKRQLGNFAGRVDRKLVEDLETVPDLDGKTMLKILVNLALASCQVVENRDAGRLQLERLLPPYPRISGSRKIPSIKLTIKQY